MRDPETTRLLTPIKDMALNDSLPSRFVCCAAKKRSSFELRECDARLVSEGPMSRRLMKLDAGELDSEVELLPLPIAIPRICTFIVDGSVCSVRNLEVKKREKVARWLLSSPFVVSPPRLTEGDSNTNLAASQKLMPYASSPVGGDRIFFHPKAMNCRTFAPLFYRLRKGEIT